MTRLFVSKRAAAIVATVTFALGIWIGAALADVRSGHACSSWGGTYQHPNPVKESPKVCWPVVQR